MVMVGDDLDVVAAADLALLDEWAVPGFRSCGRFWGMIAGVDAGRSVACSSTASKFLAARLCPFRWFELLVVV